jgi:redox-sensitive bicupin YhaK (pirin superfamily)
VAIEMDAGASLVIPRNTSSAVYPVDGNLEVDGETLPAEHLVVLTPGEPVTIKATMPSRVMLLGGDPTDGRRFITGTSWQAARKRSKRPPALAGRPVSARSRRDGAHSAAAAPA